MVVMRNRDNEVGEDLLRPLDNIDVAVGNRIKTAPVDRSLSHISSASFYTPSLS